MISGSADSGIGVGFSGSADNRIQGNFIGTDATGKVAIPNVRAGIFFSDTGASLPNNIVGGSTPGAGNLISGNGVGNGGAGGIFVYGNVAGLKVQGNLIGTDVTG